MIDDDEIEETELDEVDLLILDLAEIFVAYGISQRQALELLGEKYPVAHLGIMSESDPDTLH